MNYRRILVSAVSVVLLAVSAAAQTQLRFATSLSSSTGHVYGAGIATIVNKYSDKVKINAFASSGVVENDRLLRAGNAQIVMHGSGQLIASYNGTDAFKDNPFTKEIGRASCRERV